MRTALVVSGVLIFVIGTALAVANPFGGARASDGVSDNGAPTAVRTVERRSLTAQQTLTGTLGYSGAWTVSAPPEAPAGDPGSARAAYLTAQASLAGDEQALETAEAELQAARLQASSDCAGAEAATATTATSPCMASLQQAETDAAALPAVRAKVASDRAQLSAARAAAASARSGSLTYTMLPAVGDVVRRGQALYATDGQDTLLLYGVTPAWRGFNAGMSPGGDVAELNANLNALGLGADAGDAFTGATEHAVEALQQSRGLAVTGSLPLGAIVFEPGAVRVTSVTPAIGQPVQPGSIMTLTSTRHTVTIQVDVSQQSQVKAGDRVLATLPDNSTTPGIVASVGKVASVAPAGQGSSASATPGSPSIPVAVRLLRPADAGTLDQAPVNVLITTARVRSALVVPITALVALAGGGYALEEVTGTTRRLIPVTPGLFDDQEGLVQVEGAGLAAGQRVVVPAS